MQGTPHPLRTSAPSPLGEGRSLNLPLQGERVAAMRRRVRGHFASQPAARWAHLALLRGTTSGNARLGTRGQGLSWAAWGVAQALLPVLNVVEGIRLGRLAQGERSPAGPVRRDDVNCGTGLALMREPFADLEGQVRPSWDLPPARFSARITVVIFCHNDHL
jgi:hypothetical protein